MKSGMQIDLFRIVIAIILPLISIPAKTAIALKPSFFLSINKGIPPDFAQHLILICLLLNTASSMKTRFACYLYISIILGNILRLSISIAANFAVVNC